MQNDYRSMSDRDRTLMLRTQFWKRHFPSCPAPGPFEQQAIWITGASFTLLLPTISWVVADAQ
jgi:hypothetical protein